MTRPAAQPAAQPAGQPGASPAGRRARRVTGRHIAVGLVAFFGLVIAVNIAMARLAVGTFGGTVVDNSYVASQRYNQWLAEARAQDALGWRIAARLDADRRLLVEAQDALGRPLTGALVTAVADHPLGRQPSLVLTFAAPPPGGPDTGPASTPVWRARQPLPAGRWTVLVAVGDGANRHRSLHRVQ